MSFQLGASETYNDRFERKASQVNKIDNDDNDDDVIIANWKVQKVNEDQDKLKKTKFYKAITL
jgi:formaldehyde-activating enzyme involved in methanogenesis